MPYQSTLSGGGGPSATIKPAPIGGGGGGSLGGLPSVEGIGKGSIDITDPVGSIGETLGSFGQFGGSVLGGVAGAIGSLGPDADTASIGQLIEDLGRIPGGIGDFKRPWDADDPTAPTLGQAAGMGIGQAIGALGTPGRFVETEAAKLRARTGSGLDPRALLGAGGQAAMLADRLRGVDQQALPQDLQDALDAGQMTVDQVADALVERGQGFSSDAGANLAAQIVLDPLNLIAPGASKAAQAAKAAGKAINGGKIAAEIGVSERVVGTIYNATANGLSRAGGVMVEKVVGPVTSGVFHVLTTKAYKGLVSGAGKINPDYGTAFERNFALGAGQLPRAVMAREIMNDVGSKLARRTDDVEGAVARRLQAKTTTHADELQRRTEELLGRVAADLPVITDDVVDLTHKQYAAASGMSVEDAARVLGSKPDRNTVRSVHLAYYGHAGGELAELKKVIPSSKKLDVERLTVLAPDTLTDELADAIIAGDISPAAAVETFSQLSNHFGAKVVADSDVLAFVAKLKEADALPEAVRLPKSGKNALPKELGDWRARNADFGYELGFAPKDGWKSIIDDDGKVIMSDPFVHFTSDVDPVTMRNPLGRFIDGLMRGTTQTVIVQQSRERMVDFVTRAGVPVSPNQIRAIHKDIINTAADAKETPRALEALKSGGESVITGIFRRHLTNEEFDALTAKFDPWMVVNKAFEGNLRTVGLTQKITGKVKSAPAGGQLMVRITESLYPKARFQYRPNFQLQEFIETKVFNALRGVTDRPVSDDLLAAYRGLAEQPEFRYLTDANLLFIAGDREVVRFMGKNSKVGRAMGRFTNISGGKEAGRVRQVMYEHGEDFKEAVQKINPKFWRAMEDAYGTTDPRIIADRFLAERLTLGSGEDIDAAMSLVDDASRSIQAAYDAGDIAAGQAQNIAEGVRRGGSAASGGAVKAEGALPSGPSDMVLQAFKDSFREASNRAFQTHFFNPQRGWLERSLNHPYLGLYPLSYMWGKVLPEFTRFLVKRPFGVDAPLVGLANLERVQQAYLGALAEDPEFSKFIQEQEGAIYFANLLFPGNPVNMTVNAPAWARHVGEKAATNEARAGTARDVKLDGSVVTREIYDSTSYALNPTSDLLSVMKVGEGLGSISEDLYGAISEDIFANLQKSADQYDGQFPLAPAR